MNLAINNLQDQIDVTLLEDRKRRWMSDSQNSLREFYKTNLIPMSVSLSKTLKELQQELIEEQHGLNINKRLISQKTYAYGDVHSKNQDLLMVISNLKEKIKTLEKGKGVNTKFDKSVTSGKLLCVTSLPNNIAVQAKKVSNPEDKTDKSKSVTSHSTPINEKKQKNNANVIARGMYKFPKQESQKRVSKSNMNVYNSTGVESSTSVRRP
ncbi:hypothetical protein Tco_1315252 [Tanacetum coccineum]